MTNTSPMATDVCYSHTDVFHRHTVASSVHTGIRRMHTGSIHMARKEAFGAPRRIHSATMPFAS